MEEKKSRRKGSFVNGIIVGMMISLILVCIAGLAYKASTVYRAGQGASQVRYEEDSAITPEVVQKLQLLESTIDQRFYLEEMTPEELDNGMYKGMLEALGDPYSEYYTAEELNDLMTQSEGVYYGIGAYVSLDTDTSLPKIASVIEGAPAEAAGLRADDLIYQVDDTATYGLSLSEAVALIKGPEGTEVTLTLIREGETDYLEVTVERAKVESPTVNSKMLDDGMAYIQIVEFDDITTDQFADALATLRESGMQGLILDLRGNPGGNLSTVVDIARMLLPEGMIVYTEDKEGKRSEYTCDGKRQLEVPLVVLVDGNSASASEILSGAIKDYGIGTLVGTTTFGKGIVQQIIPFSDGSAVKITISAYYTPKGNNIHGIGIEPDITVEFDSETYYSTEDHYDNQLEKAKEVLGGMLK